MIEPFVCEPSAIGTIPAATAAADPDDEPPGVRSGSCGLRGLTGTEIGEFSCHRLCRQSRLPPRAISKPRSRHCAAAGLRSSGEPHSVGQSAVSMMSLTATGTPCSGPIGRPLLRH